MTAAFRRKGFQTFVLDLGYDIVGASFYALAVNMFTAPAKIAPGGVTGIATIIYTFTGAPIGTVSLAINIPLILLALRFLGKAFTLKTLKSLVISTLMIDVVFARVPAYEGNMVLSCLFGGVLLGTGLGIIFARGSTTGGADIVMKLVKLRFPHISMGRLMLAFDSMVLIAAAVAYRNVEYALYGLITIYASSKMMDAFIYGLDQGKVFYIFSRKSEEICQAIIQELNRTATLLEGRGGYSGKPFRVVLCAVRNSEYPTVKREVYNIDPDAFLIVAEAGEILGEGFRSIDAQA